MLIANKCTPPVQFCNHIRSVTKEDNFIFRQLHQKYPSAVLSWNLMAELLHLAPKQMRTKRFPARPMLPLIQHLPYQLMMLTAIWCRSVFTHLMPLSSFRRSNILHISAVCRLGYKIFKEPWKIFPLFHRTVIVSCKSYFLFIQRQLEHTFTDTEWCHWRVPDCHYWRLWSWLFRTTLELAQVTGRILSADQISNTAQTPLVLILRGGCGNTEVIRCALEMLMETFPDSKVQWANMGPAWVLSAPGEPM